MCTLWSYNRKLYLPSHRCLQTGLFRIMRAHITRTRHEDPPPYIAYASRTDVHIAYSVGTKYAFHNCASNAAYSQVLPGYPHSSAGAYAPHTIQLCCYKYNSTCFMAWTTTFCSQEPKEQTATRALLRWCQKTTQGYIGAWTLFTALSVVIRYT